MKEPCKHNTSAPQWILDRRLNMRPGLPHLGAPSLYMAVCRDCDEVIDFEVMKVSSLPLDGTACIEDDSVVVHWPEVSFGRDRAYRKRPVRSTVRARVVLLALIVISLLLMLHGCTSVLPMTGSKLDSALSEADVKRLAAITQLSEDQVRDPTIHEVHEVRLSFGQLLDECYPSVPLYLKLLGSIPLGCTKIIQQPWNEKVAIVYHFWGTDPVTMAHEREHAKGATHAHW